MSHEELFPNQLGHVHPRLESFASFPAPTPIPRPPPPPPELEESEGA